MEGLESGRSDEDQLPGDNKDGKLGTLSPIRDIKQEEGTGPSTMGEPQIKSEQSENMGNNPVTSPSVKSPTIRSPTNQPPTTSSSSKQNSMKWFSIVSKPPCDPTTTRTVHYKDPMFCAGPPLLPPNSCLLAQDRMFLESVYANMQQQNQPPHTPHPHGQHPHGQHPMMPQTPIMNPAFRGHGGLPPPYQHSTPHSMYPPPQPGSSVNTSAILGLPPGVDIQRLAMTDPQKTAEILKLQTAVPKEIPEEFVKSWWKICDPDHIQKIVRAAHSRLVRCGEFPLFLDHDNSKKH